MCPTRVLSCRSYRQTWAGPPSNVQKRGKVEIRVVGERQLLTLRGWGEVRCQVVCVRDAT